MIGGFMVISEARLIGVSGNWDFPAKNIKKIRWRGRTF
jgi:hypothetical protein